jgi:hypothetical protein
MRIDIAARFFISSAPVVALLPRNPGFSTTGAAAGPENRGISESICRISESNYRVRRSGARWRIGLNRGNGAVRRARSIDIRVRRIDRDFPPFERPLLVRRAAAIENNARAAWLPSSAPKPRLRYNAACFAPRALPS